MMPFLMSFRVSAFTSGTTSGTPRSMRQALELSITRQPAAAILGDHSLGDLAARAHQADVDALEIVIVERLDLQHAVAERHFRADRTRRGEGDDFTDGKLALDEDVQHLAPDIAGRNRRRQPCRP